ncbi:29542_t:CDS:2 [Gigaspora margarita]|uniref:29542_t:CDS:1 n=1 Tax=Gigaspora margarita TaxID=4874 RepID=A0ABM8W1T6_GIGMA|nr:29542_t:CDS:2 [Gigaspora margarita]
MVSDQELRAVFHALQNPVPQYLLGLLPVLLTLGSTPYESLLEKFLWFLRCLESSKNTSNIETKIVINNKDEVDNKVISEQEFPRPFGYHVMKIKPNKSQKRILEDWIAKASLLDRLLLCLSAYYIIISVISGITKAIRPCTQDNALEDWPYIPILFIWTLPVIYVRMFEGKVVSKVLPERLKNRITIVKYNSAITKKKQNWVFAIFCFSLFLPWLSVIIAYLTPPIGVSWEKDVHGPSPVGIMFICFGAIVGLGLIFFDSLWESVFGASCNQLTNFNLANGE